MTKSRLRKKVPALRALTLEGAPISKRAIAWSPDAELAIASDDAVHVFVPQFPIPKDPKASDVLEPSSSSQQRDDGPTANWNESEDDSKAQKGKDEAEKARNATEDRRQFANGWKHIPTSLLLDPSVNAHLFENAGRPSPFTPEPMRTRGSTRDDPMDVDAEPSQATTRSTTVSYDTDDLEDSDDDASTEPSSSVPRMGITSTGAGSSKLTSAAGTMNSVVSIAWSPSYLGRNGRCLLGVLTSAGVLTIYGEGTEAKSRGGANATAGYDTTGWEVLWAVGERMVVPPQEEIGECVTSFAWAGEVGRGKGLLAYRNDQMEVVLLLVRVDYKTERSASQGPSREKEVAVWRVEEVARVLLEGPHPRGDVFDPDFIPFHSSFSLSFSPWLHGKDTKSALLGYLARNYIGFRKVTLPVEDKWPDDGLPSVEVEKEDDYGLCGFMTSDAFIEWEQAIWSRGKDGNIKVCRAVLATPLIAKCFEVYFNGVAKQDFHYHDLDFCGTRYPPATAQHSNPITGLIVHPPDPSRQNIKPTYTAVRLSATVTNPDWHKSTAPVVPTPTPEPTPDPNNPGWPTEITQKLEVAIPINLPDFEEDSDDDDEVYDGTNPDKDPTPIRGTLIALPSRVPEIHTNRVRIWGLAMSPGGGVSAVVVTHHSTQKPDKGTGRYVRSRVVFLSTPPHAALRSNPALKARSTVGKYTTEARMWEWMYGGGPGVPGLTGFWKDESGAVIAPKSATSGPTAASDPSDDAELKAREALRALFRASPSAGKPKCALCGGKMLVGRVWARCGRGHWHDVCGVSGVPILKPGVSRACGVCGGRSLRREVLLGMVEGESREKLEERLGEGCGRCGGKFVD